MTDAADIYRGNAEECLLLAKTLRDQQSRDSLINMAMAWLRLARQARVNQMSHVPWQRDERSNPSARAHSTWNTW